MCSCPKRRLSATEKNSDVVDICRAPGLEPLSLFAVSLSGLRPVLASSTEILDEHLVILLDPGAATCLSLSQVCCQDPSGLADLDRVG